MTSAIRPQPHTGLLVTLVVVAIVADQLSKAWFVYTLGDHTAASFMAFCEEYFRIFAGWDTQAGGQVVQAYFPFKPAIILWEPWLRWNLVTNTGAAWSMFAGNSFVLSGVSIILASGLTWAWYHFLRFNYGMTWAMGAIIGGALGNFIDRFRLHEVVDFIDVRLPLIGQIFPRLGHPYNFPIFNIADSCAVVGTLAIATYLIVVDIRAGREKRKQAAATAAAAAASKAFDPHHREPEEIQQIREVAEELSRQIRSGETFTPRSQTDMPLGLGPEERPDWNKPSEPRAEDENSSDPGENPQGDIPPAR